jgi:signal transduction histidine kinase
VAEGPPRLLVVDDEVTHLRALCDTLRDNGYEVEGHTRPEDALQALRASSFDLILTDLHMPGISGIELLRTALDADPALAAVMMTGAGSIGSAVDAMKSGALDYVLKPFKLKTTLPVLSRALEVRALRRKNAALEAQVRAQRDELAAANADLEAFSSSVSHDLRAPLQAISGFSEALADRYSAQLDEKGRHYLERIRVSTTHLDRLVEGLLRLARIPREPLALTMVDCSALVAGVLRDLRAAGELCDDRVQVDALPDVKADALLLQQVFANLISNACKFTAGAAHPGVHVGCAAREQELVFFVKDNGAGFDMAHAQKLYEPFHRLHKAEEFAGLGIGLSIVRRIVQRHGGRIWAEAAVGQGACFSFVLAGVATYSA